MLKFQFNIFFFDEFGFSFFNEVNRQVIKNLAAHDFTIAVNPPLLIVKPNINPITSGDWLLYKNCSLGHMAAKPIAISQNPRQFSPPNA